MGSLGSIFIKLRECSLTALLGTQRYCWGCGKTVSASLIKLFQCLKTCFVKTFIAVTSSGLGSCPILLMLAAFCWPSRCLISIFVSRSKMAKNVYQSINHFKLQHKSVFFYQLIDSVTLMQRIANIFLQLNDIFYQHQYLSSCAAGEGINEWSHILSLDPVSLPIVRTIIKPPAAARRGAAHYHIMIISRNPEIGGRPTMTYLGF